MRWELSSRTPAVLSGVASWICSRENVGLLSCSIINLSMVRSLDVDTDIFHIVTMRYTCSIDVHCLSRLRTKHVNRSNKRKWIQLNYKKQTRTRRYNDKQNICRRLSVFFTNRLAQAESKLHSLGEELKRIWIYVNANKTGFMCLKQERANSRLSLLKSVDQFTVLGNNTSSTENDVNIHRDIVGCYWKVIDHVKNGSFWQNKRAFLLSSFSVITNV